MKRSPTHPRSSFLDLTTPQLELPNGHDVNSDHTTDQALTSTPNINLVQLVTQYLEARTDGLPAASVAAFVSGWSSALDVVRRSQVSVPNASADVHGTIQQLVDAIEQAQRAALEEPE